MSARSSVLALAACAAVACAATALAAPAPLVQSMVVGEGGTVLAGPQSVTASAGTVTVAGRRCAVAAGTPLAVLIALRRAGGPAFGLRDYGHCGGAARNSAQLFVDRLGGESNRGQDGWEYKVGPLAGVDGGRRSQRDPRQRPAAATGPAGPVVLVSDRPRGLSEDTRSLRAGLRRARRDTRGPRHGL